MRGYFDKKYGRYSHKLNRENLLSNFSCIIMAKVSVIIPVFKVEKYLDRCIQSVFSQTLKDLEIILIDDGSPDRCPEMCDDYMQKDSRIKVIHKSNEGLGNARNSGLEIATGEYISFLDSDDYVHPEMYLTLYNSAKEYGVDAVLCGFMRDDRGRIYNLPIDGMPDNATEIDFRTEYLPRVIGALPNEKNNQYYGISSCNLLIRAGVVRDNRLRFESERQFVSEDFLFLLDLAAHADKLLLLPRNFYYYCNNSESLTQKYDATRFNRQVCLYHEVCRRVKSYGLHVPQMELRTDRMMLYETLFAVSDAIRHLPKAQSVAQLNDIASEEALRCVLDRYPIKEMTLSCRLLYTLLKEKNTNLLWILYKLKKLFG